MTNRLLHRLRTDESGVALIEFAFIGPIMALLIVASLELANYGIAHVRVSQIAMSVADNAGRTTTGIDEANIYEVFAGAGVIGNPIEFEQNGRIVLSSLEDNGLTGTKRGQYIRWQRCWGELDAGPLYGVQGDGRTDAKLVNGVGPDGNRIAAIPGTATMFVEVTFDYEPLIGSSWVNTGPIHYESAFNVRGRQNQVISNTQGLAQLSC
jgi:Flp pilus assembly pilin Flp